LTRTKSQSESEMRTKKSLVARQIESRTKQMGI